MPNPSVHDEPVSVALLYQTSQLEGHLKEALKDLGAAVVYEALTAQMDRDALEGSGAHVVIVNLDPDIEAHLDEVYDLLDDDRYNVVFNDAQVSSGLSGWEQARWSRHLAAKIMGRPEVADPPRPAGAEAPPSPTQKIARSIPDATPSAAPSATFAPDEAATALFAGESGLSGALDALFSQNAAPAAPAARPAGETSSGFGFDFDELLGAGPPPPASSSAITQELPVVAPAAASLPRAADPNLDLPPPPPQDSDALDFDFDLPPAPVVVPAATSVPPALDLDFDLAPPPPAAAADLDLDLAFDTPPAAAPAAAATGTNDFSLDFDLGALDLPEPSVPTRPAASDPGAGDFGDGDFGADPFGAGQPAGTADAEPDFSFGAELDALFDTPAAAPVAQPTAELVDFDAAFGGGADAPAADANLVANVPVARDAEPPAKPAAKFEMPSSLSSWSLEPLTEDGGDETAAPTPPPAAKSADFGVQKMSAESFLSGGNWSLEDIVESTGDDAPAAAAAPAPSAPTAVAVEKVAAQDYLAPEGGDASKFDFDTSLKLDLMPMEEAVSPDRPEFVVEHRLDGSSSVKSIRRVFVLGASIGGPEAVREFLAALPPRFPALFVLAQHMGAEFLELMAAQLAKATPLTVRSPTHGERISHGDVVVVPTTHRLLFDADGVVQLAHLPEASPYTPSIDLIVRDVADRFGAAATLIIFSGMAHDAIEGARHLAAKGGKVWVQDPDTCVISSMVDGARDAGIVSFTGSPAELAKQTIEAIKG